MPQDKTETERAKEFRLRTAERAHDSHVASLARADARALSYANSAMRTPGVAAAGAAGAALVFWSGNYEQISASPEAKEALRAVLLYVGGGLLVSMASPMLAYVSAESNAESHSEKILTWEHPFKEDTRASRFKRRMSLAFDVLAILSVLGSATLVGLGLWNFYLMVEALSGV